MPVPRGLERTRTSPGRAPAFVQIRSGWTSPCTASPKIGSSLRIVWPPAMAPPGLGHDGAGGGEDRLDGRDRQPLGEGRDVEREDDPRAHGEHVAAGVGGGDGAEVGRVVDERREEVGRRDHGQVVGQPVHGGVVERRQAHEEGGVRGRRQVPDQGRQRCRPPLGGASAARRPLGQPQRPGARLGRHRGRVLLVTALFGDRLASSPDRPQTGGRIIRCSDRRASGGNW